MSEPRSIYAVVASEYESSETVIVFACREDAQRMVEIIEEREKTRPSFDGRMGLPEDEWDRRYAQYEAELEAWAADHPAGPDEAKVLNNYFNFYVQELQLHEVFPEMTHE